VRFTGMSGHGGNLIECLDYGLDNDLFDVILVAHNFGQDPAFYARFLKDFDSIAINPDLPSRIEKAHKQGVGVIVMKTRMGAKLNDLSAYRADGSTASQAAFRWVLASENVDALVVTMSKPQEVTEFLGASGESRLRAGDVALLRAHLEGAGQDYCRHGCSACDASCPYDVAISEVLRTRMYATHYEDRAMASASYARIGNDATACLTCSVQMCAGACPYGLDIPSLTRATPGIVGVG
jgi:predicted aldo/keto reductase-like oxidoreductase